MFSSRTRRLYMYEYEVLLYGVYSCTSMEYSSITVFMCPSRFGIQIRFANVLHTAVLLYEVFGMLQQYYYIYIYTKSVVAVYAGTEYIRSSTPYSYEDQGGFFPSFCPCDITCHLSYIRAQPLYHHHHLMMTLFTAVSSLSPHAVAPVPTVAFFSSTSTCLYEYHNSSWFRTTN